MPVDVEFNEDLEALAAYLAHYDLVTLAELHGVITAAVSGPKSILPTRWLSALKLDKFSSIEEISAVISTITDMHNKAVDDLVSKRYYPLLHYDRLYDEIYACEFEVASAWSRGYLMGVELHQDKWSLLGGNEIVKLLSPIVTLSNGDDQSSDKLFKSNHAGLLSRSAIDIYYFWHEDEDEDTNIVVDLSCSTIH